MNDRLLGLLVASFGLHLLLLVIFPAPGFDESRTKTSQAVRVKLSQRQMTRDEPSRQEKSSPSETTRKQQEKKEVPEREPMSGELENKRSDRQTNSVTPKKLQEPAEPPPPENPRSKSNPEATKPPTTPTKTTEKSTRDNAEPTGTSKDDGDNEQTDYSLLQRGEGMSRSLPPTSNNTKPTERRTVLSKNGNYERYKIIESEQPDRPDTSNIVRVQIPREDRQQPKTVEIPSYTVNTDESAVPIETDPDKKNFTSQPVSRGDRRILERPLPKVPAWLEKTGEEVQVILRYRISVDGDVSSVSVVKSSGYTELDSLSVQNVENWTFEAGQHSERRLTVFKFVLKK